MSNKYFPARAKPDAGIEEDLYVVPEANTAVATSLRITNASAAKTKLNVKVVLEGGADSYKLLSNRYLPSDAVMDILSGAPCVMNAGEKMVVESSQADVHFYLSYLEMDRN